MPFDLREETMLLVAAEEAELDHARMYAAALGAEEYDTRGDPWLADDLAGAYAIPGGSLLDPLGATIAMAEAARRAGAELRTGCAAARILVEEDRARGVATDAGVIAAEHVVVAAGPRSRFLLRTAGVDLPIASTRGWLLETTRIENPPPYSIEQAVWPTQAEMAPLARDRTLGELAAAGPDEPGLVSALLGVHGAGQLRIGTSLARSLREEPEGADMPRRLAERAVRIAPHLADVPVVAAWSGRRSMTPDGLPVVGPVPGVEGLEVASGFSSIGMITVPAACMRLAGEPDPAFDPGRFV